MAARAVNTVSDRSIRENAYERKGVDQIRMTTKQLAKQMAEVQQQLKESRLMDSGPKCVTCGSPYCGEYCSETHTEDQENALGQVRNDPFSNSSNPGWRTHPNFAWKNRDQGNNNNAGQGGNGFQRQYPNQRFQGQGFRQQPNQEQGSGSKKSLEEMFERFMTRTENISKKQEAAIKNLETQVGQLAKQMSERPSGTFPSDTQIPRTENASVITTRSGKVLNEVPNKVEKEVITEKVVLNNQEEKNEKPRESDKNPSNPTLSKVPFPKALVKKNLEKQFSKFMEVFKKLQINIPFSDALEQMPTYAKFMKDILSRRRKLRDLDETIMMTENCSAI